MLEPKEIVAAEFQSMIDRISANLDSTGTTASGKTKKTLRVEITDFGVVVFSRQFFKGVEIGREPGGVPKGFNDIIKKWIVDKNINIRQVPYKRKTSKKWQPKYTTEERSLNMLAGAISNKIKNSGTKLFREGGRNDIYSNELSNTLEIIKKKIVSETVSQIKLNTKK